MESTHVVQQFDGSCLRSSTHRVEILGLELHLLSGCVQVRAVQLSSPVLPALRILSSRGDVWKESQRHGLHSYCQTTWVEPIQAPPRQVAPGTAHTSCLVDKCSIPGEPFLLSPFPRPSPSNSYSSDPSSPISACF